MSRPLRAVPIAENEPNPAPRPIVLAQVRKKRRSWRRWVAWLRYGPDRSLAPDRPSCDPRSPIRSVVDPRDIYLA